MIFFYFRYYTIVGTRTIRGNSDYHVAVTSHNLPNEVDIRVGVKGSDESNVKSVDFFKTVTVAPGETKLVEIPIGPIFDGKFKLYADGIRGIEFKNETDLEFNTKEYSLFIQTDKAVYKPGDLIRFRVIFLDGNLKTPQLKKPIQVYITDAGQNRIKQFSNITLTKGVFSNELQLSTDPVLGKWNLVIDVDGTTENKNFDVEEYVLPKFEVIVKPERHSTFKDGKITASIETKYTYGKPVKGEVTISAYPTLYVGSLQPFERQIISRKVMPIDGRVTVDFNIKDELKLADESERDVIIEAVVEEALTGRKQNSSGKVTLHKNKYNVEIKGENTYKPGLPYAAYASVTYHDGSPVRDKTKKVFVNIESQEDYYYWRNPESENKEETKFTEDRELELDDNGQAKIKFSPPEGNFSRFRIQAKYQDVSYDYFYIRKDDSKVEEYIQVRVVTDAPKLNKEVTVEVRSTKELKSITYQVIGRGDVLVSQTVDVPNAKIVSFRFLSTFLMVPTAKIHAYYVSSETGQIISDTTEITFPSNFQNPLKIDLSKTQAQPGEDVDLTITTNPNSYVGLLGVDQSVLLLKGGNDLDRNAIFDSLKKYDEQSYSYSPWRGKRQVYSYQFPAFFVSI